MVQMTWYNTIHVHECGVWFVEGFHMAPRAVRSVKELVVVYS